MNKEMKDFYKELCKQIEENVYYEDIPLLPIEYYEKKRSKISPTETKIHVGLLNAPCAGFGDIIACKTFYDYLKEWYPSMKVTICTSSPDKFQQLKIKGDILPLQYPHNSWQGGECKRLDQLKLGRVKGGKPRFDILIVVPVVNVTFYPKMLHKIFPYANLFNTFSISEYNGEVPPYTFPIGVGEGMLGLFLTNNLKIPQQKIINKPYALAYTAGHDTAANTHTDTCLLSFIEMICKKYHKKHPRFQLVVPPWFKDELLAMNNLKTRYNNIVKKYYSSSYLVYNKDEDYNLFDQQKNTTCFILRGDILPQPRELFISLIKDSVPDVLLTGDQSLTDGLSYCRKNKRLWYQVAPWKIDLAYQVGEVIGNEYLDNFRTSCGTLKGIRKSFNNEKLTKHYDFRKLGKKRMDGILRMHSNKDHPLLVIFKECYQRSRFKETMLAKFQKAVELKYNL